MERVTSMIWKDLRLAEELALEDCSGFSNRVMRWLILQVCERRDSEVVKSFGGYIVIEPIALLKRRG